MCGLTPALYSASRERLISSRSSSRISRAARATVGSSRLRGRGSSTGNSRLDAPGTESEQNDAIAQANRFADIVRDENDGASGFGPDAFQFVVQQVAGLGVESGERFVHQQDVGLGGEGARDGDALTHAAGELVNVAVFELAKVYQPQIVLRLLAALGFRNPFIFMPNSTFCADREPGKQSMILEDQDAIGSGPSNGIAVHQDLTRGLRIESGNQVQQRGLAAAGWTNDAEKFSRANFKIDVVESERPFPGLCAVAKADLVQTQPWETPPRPHGRGWSTCSWTWLGASAAIDRNWELTRNALWCSLNRLSFFSART